MHRLGFEEKDMPLLAERLSSQDNLSARSVFSHFAGSDEACFDDYSRHQIALFTRCADAVQAASPHKVLRHILNTAGITRFTDFQFDAVRLGIGLYGVSPYGDNKGLRTVSIVEDDDFADTAICLPEKRSDTVVAGCWSDLPA